MGMYQLARIMQRATRREVFHRWSLSLLCVAFSVLLLWSCGLVHSRTSRTLAVLRVEKLCWSVVTWIVFTGLHLLLSRSVRGWSHYWLRVTLKNVTEFGSEEFGKWLQSTMFRRFSRRVAKVMFARSARRLRRDGSLQRAHMVTLAAGHVRASVCITRAVKAWVFTYRCPAQGVTAFIELTEIPGSVTLSEKYSVPGAGSVGLTLLSIVATNLLALRNVSDRSGRENARLICGVLEQSVKRSTVVRFHSVFMWEVSSRKPRSAYMISDWSRSNGSGWKHLIG